MGRGRPLSPGGGERLDLLAPAASPQVAPDAAGKAREAARARQPRGQSVLSRPGKGPGRA